MTGDKPQPLETLDGHYIVVRGRLWRRANPNLGEDERQSLVATLMSDRRAVAAARRAGNVSAEADAHTAVDVAKHGPGERGAVWWEDGTPDLNRHVARNTHYAAWFAEHGGLNAISGLLQINGTHKRLELFMQITTGNAYVPCARHRG